jgi:ketosteroid isomerase-like protein
MPRTLPSLYPVLMSALVACSPPSHTGGEAELPDSAGLGETRAAFQQAVLQNDATVLAEFYADSAVFMAPGLPTLRGRPAIESLLRKALSATRYESFEFEPVAVSGRAGVVIEVGRQRDLSRSNGQGQIAYGRYMITWVRSAAGRWQMAMDATIVDSTRPAVPGRDVNR